MKVDPERFEFFCDMAFQPWRSETDLHQALMVMAACWLDAMGFDGVRFRPSMVGTYRARGMKHYFPDVYGAHFGVPTNAVIEAKASRRDYELSLSKYNSIIILNPAGPRSPFAEHHYVIAPRGMVSPLRVPPMWGLLEVDGDEITIVKEAVRVDCKMHRMSLSSSLAWRPEHRGRYRLLESTRGNTPEVHWTPR